MKKNTRVKHPVLFAVIRLFVVVIVVFVCREFMLFRKVFVIIRSDDGEIKVTGVTCIDEIGLKEIVNESGERSKEFYEVLRDWDQYENHAEYEYTVNYNILNHNYFNVKEKPGTETYYKIDFELDGEPNVAIISHYLLDSSKYDRMVWVIDKDYDGQTCLSEGHCDNGGFRKHLIL